MVSVETEEANYPILRVYTEDLSNNINKIIEFMENRMPVGIAMGAAVGMESWVLLVLVMPLPQKTQQRLLSAHQVGQETWKYGEAVWGTAQRERRR